MRRGSGEQGNGGESASDSHDPTLRGDRRLLAMRTGQTDRAGTVRQWDRLDESQVKQPRCPRRPTRSPAPSRLDGYESIAAASGDMLAAARKGDWDEVARLQRHCLACVQRLQAAQELRADEQACRFRLLRKVLADDAEIRRLAEPRFVQIESWLLPPRHTPPTA